MHNHFLEQAWRVFLLSFAMRHERMITAVPKSRGDKRLCRCIFEITETAVESIGTMMSPTVQCRFEFTFLINVFGPCASCSQEYSYERSPTMRTLITYVYVGG